MGDFNSHSQSWGYDHIDARGEEIEARQDDNNIHPLINHMTRRLSTPDAGTLPVHQTSHYVQKIYTASQWEKSAISSEEVTTDQHT